MNFLTTLPSNVSGSLVTLLSLAATAFLGYYTDSKEIVQMPKGTLIQVSGCIASLVLGLIVYTLSIYSKLGKKEERKARISKWRDELNSCASLEDFYDKQAYTELQSMLTKQEQNAINQINSEGNRIYIIEGAISQTQTPESRLFACYRKAINRIEQDWSLI